MKNFKNFKDMASIFAQSLKMVMRNISANKKRSVLTCLGVILGVASIMTMSALFNVESQLNTMLFNMHGYTNLYYFFLSHDLMPRGITDTFMSDLEHMDEVTKVIAFCQLDSDFNITGNRNTFKNANILARNDEFFKYDSSVALVTGRFINKEDEDKAAMVCLLDKKIARKLFISEEKAVGKRVQFGGSEFTVVGVDAMDGMRGDRLYAPGYDQVTIPCSTMLRVFGKAPDSIGVYVNDPRAEVQIAVDERICSYLSEKYHMTKNMEFFPLCFADMLHEQEQEYAKSASEQTLISSICLFVGGIGIMNMMYVSVTERTREIGLRKALGANPARIQEQFVAESIILSLTGGIIGVILGLIATLIIDIFMYNMAVEYMGGDFAYTPYIGFGAMTVGLISSLVVGVIFGWMPARKASKLSPIDALKL